jgi:outer membrane protein assembly factor BamA
VTFVAALVFTAGPQQPPAGMTYQLAAVQVAGAKRYSADDVTRLSGLVVGKPVTVADLQPAADRLTSSGLFKELRYRYVTAAKQMTVVFEFEEADWTVPVIFDNLIWFTDEELVAAVRRDVPSFDGTAPSNEGVPELIIGALQRLLDQRGIPGTAGIVPQTDLKTKELRYLFSVKEPAPRVCTVSVDGATPDRRRDLLDAMRSVVGTGYSRFYMTGMAGGTLLDIYHRYGHWKAAFAPLIARAVAECAGASVVLQVSEGPIYQWAGAQWSGNAAIPAGQLDKLLAMREGDVADSSKINDGLRRIKKAYGRIGHLLAAADPAPRLDDAATRAVFEMTVNEGPQFRMGTVQFIGFPESVADSLQKAWKLAPGAVYDDAYPGDFDVKEVVSRRRPGGKRPVMQMEIDRARRVVNIRFVAG